MQRLSSYCLGSWRDGAAPFTALHDPTTEEQVAECGNARVDFAAVARHAREQGGPALRALGFQGRGRLLKEISGALHERREELIEIAVKNGGTTRGDAKFDIDGAIGTLAAYAGFAQSLGSRETLEDGEGIQLGRTPRFHGQHVLVPRRGVAVHVNAFNFPAWGMMEKLACALLAGVPAIEKPGTPTALVAWRIAQIAVASGLLPEGSYQFIAGSVGDLLDHLGAQDCLAFTGSAATGAKLKANAHLVQRNVRVNIEADSLNTAVLAPEVDASSETYGLFLSNVVLDMTQKAGQKCTAVRRIVVPRERAEDVKRDLVAELQRIVVGDPGDKATRMGPLSSRSQLDEVRGGIRRFAAVCQVACGGPEPVRPKGYFVQPTLFAARDAEVAIVHEEEIFGPVATIVPYGGGAEEAAAIAARGGGGLVSSAYSNDGTWSEQYAIAAAPWHGRIWIGSDRMAEQSLPPGMVLPSLVHGGPGRAGGGEELGGLRGLAFYMQRTALQGFKGAIEASFGASSAS